MCIRDSNIVNPEGGTHLAGFRTAITTALNNYAQKAELLRGVDGTLNGADVREGLTAIVSIKVADPQFEGQTKIKLNNREVKGVVAKLVRDELLTYLGENPQEAKNIIGKAVLANKAKAAAKAARDAVIRKSVLESTTLPGKLADCTSNDPKESELFIVEGDSAGGSAKQGRDRHTQAILPLRGKIMNTQKYRVDRVLTNSEFNDVTTALGVGIGETLDSSKIDVYKRQIFTSAMILSLIGIFFKSIYGILKISDFPLAISSGSTTPNSSISASSVF